MIQTCYADSGDTPEDETGMSQKGISTTVNRWQVAVGIRCDFGG